MMRKDLSSIDVLKTILRCVAILILGSLVLFLLVRLHIWTVIAPADKIFVGLLFIILFSTLGIRYKKDVKKRRK